MKSAHLVLLTAILLFAFSSQPAAVAQSAQDWKIFPGNSAVIRTCNFSPAPVANVSATNTFSPFVTGTAPASETCTASISLTRDHQNSVPVAVQVHVTQNSVASPHGVIGCQLIATNVKNNGGTLSYRQTGGAVSTINYNSANAGIMQTMSLAMPGPLGDGGVYVNGALTVTCTVGNDFFVEDVTLIENGTD